MSLADRVTESMTTARLTELTCGDTTGSTTPDITILGLACTDAEAEFALYVGSAYDEDDAAHVSLAVQGVVLILARYAGGRDLTDEYQRAWDRWVASCKTLGAAGARARIVPATNSLLTPSTEVESGETVRPDFDREFFADRTPGATSNDGFWTR